MEQEESPAKSPAEFKKEYADLLEKIATYRIPIAIMETKELSLQAKHLFCVIASVSYKTGEFYATNDFLCQKLFLKKTMVVLYLKELEDKGLIIKQCQMTKRGISRKIYIESNKIFELDKLVSVGTSSKRYGFDKLKNRKYKSRKI